jgi:hypothetical protein
LGEEYRSFSSSLMYNILQEAISSDNIYPCTQLHVCKCASGMSVSFTS